MQGARSDGDECGALTTGCSQRNTRAIRLADRGHRRRCGSHEFPACCSTSARGRGDDYVHAAVDDHSRLAYAEILTDEKGTTCAGFLTRAAAFYARHGMTIEHVITDNALNYRRSQDFAAAVTTIGARQKFIRPHCPWTNGKQDCATLLPTWLDHYNLNRPHLGIGGHALITRINNGASKYT